MLGDGFLLFFQNTRPPFAFPHSVRFGSCWASESFRTLAHHSPSLTPFGNGSCWAGWLYSSHPLQIKKELHSCKHDVAPFLFASVLNRFLLLSHSLHVLALTGIDLDDISDLYKQWYLDGCSGLYCCRFGGSLCGISLESRLGLCYL